MQPNGTGHIERLLNGFTASTCTPGPTGSPAGSAGVDVAAVADGHDADNAPLIIDRVHDPIVTDSNAPQPV